MCGTCAMTVLTVALVGTLLMFDELPFSQWGTVIPLRKRLTWHVLVAPLMVRAHSKAETTCRSHQTVSNGSCMDHACMLCYSLADVASQCNTSVLLAQGATPLLLAAVKGHVSLANKLLSNKADAYAVDPWVRHKRFMPA